MTPRDRFVTVYGRLPVLEALADERVEVAGVVLARTVRGEAAEAVLAAAGRRGVPVERAAPGRVTRLSGNGRHDQGVVADVVVPGAGPLAGWAPPAEGPAALLVLDGVTNPANVGMVLRTATAAGLEGVVLPRAGVAEVGPLVVKASAGVAYRATILRCATAVEAVEVLAGLGLEVVGLAAGDAPPLWSGLPERAAYVLGSETDGLSAPVAGRIGTWRSIPLAGGVESLNVASAASVLAYEVARRRARRVPE